MQTTIYKNWISKTQECGLTNEQACGIAILYAWTLTQRKLENESPDTESFWKFVEEDDFIEISKTSFSIDDFGKFIPVLKLAGEVLNVPMPGERLDASGEPATLLNLEWQDAEESKEKGNDLLLMRHRFDMLWCQAAGETLRPEIRTPRHAYVFADYLSHGFLHFDPQGFSRILDILIGKKSPFLSTLTSKFFVTERGGLDGYEPFQIALLGFHVSPEKLGEQLWNTQRTLFYKQPSGEPTKTDKQYLPPPEFIEYSLPILMEFIKTEKSSFIEISELVADEYILRSNEESQFFDQFCGLMATRYGFSSALINESKCLNILINVAAFYTAACLTIRNLTNRISELPTLRMLDDEGLLWARDIDEPQPLRDEAIQCFDVMLSWRFGDSWGLFLETDSGFHRIYISDGPEYKDVEGAFEKICLAYQPKRCVISFFINGNQIAFLGLSRDGSALIDIFQAGANLERGCFLGDYIGFTERKNERSPHFEKVRQCLMNASEAAQINDAQMELSAITRNPEVWQFKGAPSAVEKRADWSIATASLEELKEEALRLFADQNFAELIPVLSEMESQGSAWGAHYLAGCYSLGNGVDVDAERANELMRGAADLGLVESQTVLGRNLLVGYGAPKDVSEGLRYLNKAAAQGSAFAIYLLGEDSLSGSCETPQDPGAAAKLFQQSADLGEHRAMQRLAWLYSNGLGVEIDLAEALRLNMAAAELGNEWAAFNAARAFERGLGTAVDAGLALRFYEMAVQGSLVMAMHNLGALLFNGKGVERDVEKAFQWYLKAANFGSGLSSLCLGQIYEAGDRGDVDLPMATTWYLISIAQSDNDAQARFDSIRARLSDVEKQSTLSIVTAFAEKGFHWGQVALSHLYANGTFCAQDELQSEKWAAAAESSKADADVMSRQM